MHALTFSLTGVGFVAQAELTIEGYGKTTIEALREAEPDDGASGGAVGSGFGPPSVVPERP